jgi:hypothetical protein
VSTQAVRFFKVMLLMAAVGVVRAADPVPTATDAEKSYLELRKSKDTKTQLLAERWYGLVQLREWSDTSGKFKTTAKYVEQDDKEGTVKLRVIKGSGSDQVVKDKTIAVDKLSKECQSRVKQIAFLADKVSEAEKAEAEKAAKPKDGSDAGMGAMPPPPNERDPNSPKSKPDRPGAKSKAKTTSDQAEHPATEEPSAALPAAMPELPVVAAASPDARAAAAAERDASAMPPAAAPINPSASDARGEQRPALPANLPDQQPWRTSFAAFAAQLKPERTESGWQLNWGELTALKKAHDDAIAMSTGPGARDLASSTPSYEALGEVSWEAALSQQPDEQIDWSKALGLNLPEPFRLICELDKECGTGDWRRFFPGDRVKLIGRFTGFEGDGGIHLAIRFPNDVPATIPDRSAGRR